MAHKRGGGRESISEGANYRNEKNISDHFETRLIKIGQVIRNRESFEYRSYIYTCSPILSERGLPITADVKAKK